MSDDAGPEPSFFLARHENAHREHNHDHDHSHSGTRRHHNHNHHAHNIVHQAVKKRQQSTVIEQVNAVTTVIATVSYVQQIDVDQNGSTFSIERILTSASSGAPAATTTPADQTNPVTVPTAGSSSAASSAQPDSSSQSLLSISSTTQPFSTSSAPQIPITSSFSSLAVNSNSTTTPLITSSSSFSSSAFSNSTSSSSRSSLTYLTSESSASSSFSSTSSFSSSPSTSLANLSFSSSSSAEATSTFDGGGGLVGGASGVAPSSVAPSSTETAVNSTSGSSPPPAGVIAGSVVGSLAGFAFLVLLILFLARWKKRKNMLSLGNGNEAGDSSTTRGLPPAAPVGGMVERGPRRSSLFAVPAALASLTGYNNRSSRQTEGTLSSTGESERGFYRVSGRKLPSVLHTGGDGYGTVVPGEANTLSGSSFYRDSTGFYGGHGPTSSSPLAVSPAGMTIDRASGVPVMRPSPARTPVTEHGPWPMATPPPLQPPRRPEHPDSLGRSHPSQDGSHASRFTEEV